MILSRVSPRNAGLWFSAPREKSLPDAVRLIAHFKLMMKLFALLYSLGQVGVNFALVFQVLTDHRNKHQPEKAHHIGEQFLPA